MALPTAIFSIPYDHPQPEIKRRGFNLLIKSLALALAFVLSFLLLFCSLAFDPKHLSLVETKARAKILLRFISREKFAFFFHEESSHHLDKRAPASGVLNSVAFQVRT